MITVRDLHASYEGEEILHGIDADFPEGKISVLMGPNGCGKSTTLRSLLRLVPPKSCLPRNWHGTSLTFRRAGTFRISPSERW